MLFMSSAHVEAMNQALRQSVEFQSVAATLPRQMALTYELQDGPQGQTIHWTFRTGPEGTEFSLMRPEQPSDIRIRADWAEMIRAAIATRRGEHQAVAMDVQGDQSDLRRIEAVLQIARRVATLDCEFPAIEGVLRAP